MSSNFRYLTFPNGNVGKNEFFSRLVQALNDAQNKASPSQWKSLIQNLTKKGIKQAEINDRDIISWLNDQERSGEKSILKADLLSQINRQTPIIKEIELTGRSVQYGNYRHSGQNEKDYAERLYILGSEKMFYADRLAQIRFEMEELDFNPSLLASDPNRALRLYEEQQEVIAKSKRVDDFKIPHFSDIIDPESGKKLANVLAHVRSSQFDDLFFIQEIQSDWAQKGRRTEWAEIPKAPFIVDTELWAGLILRRQMQLAAQNPGVNRVAWIVGSMRNGWDQSNRIRSDGLDKFYTDILPKIANKSLAKTSESVKFIPITLGDKNFEVPGFNITDSAREALKGPQALYSHDLAQEAIIAPFESRRILQEQMPLVQRMLGSCAEIRIMGKVMDAISGDEVAGQQVGNLIEVSLRARNPALILPHEAWHFAYEHLIGPLDKDIIDAAFADGCPLNTRVRQALVRDGASPSTVAQCDDPREAAAHGFSLWINGKMELTLKDQFNREYAGDSLTDRTVGRWFKKVESTFFSLGQWIKEHIGPSERQAITDRTQSVFEALANGALARTAVHQRAPNFPERLSHHDGWGNQHAMTRSRQSA